MFQASVSEDRNYTMTMFGRLLLSFISFKNYVISFSRVELKSKQNHGYSCNKGVEILKVSRAGSESLCQLVCYFLVLI